jgi:flagellar motor switch/type III secretory pathway protein FliN
MNDQAYPSQQASPSLTPESLGVTVDIVIGSRSLTLAEISGMKEGHVIEWEGGNPATAKIVVNGREIGSGRIVTVGDHLGLVVESLVP